MRVPKSWVPLLAKRIADNLVSRELLRPTVPAEKFLAETEALIMGELMVEDRLNDEVREILRQHAADIEKGRMDYRKVFELTKQKLVKERNLVL